MTELLFQTDSYLQEFEARVIAVASQAVALERTAFYAGGGGQPCDLGVLRIGGREPVVTKVWKNRDDDRVWHEIADGLPTVGESLHGRIDWERRYQLMRTHTAMHILCGVVFRDYGALVTGGNMEPLRGRLDFEFESMTRELVDEIEVKLNSEIAAARPVLVKILPRAEAFQIPDLIRTKINLLPEGITHVRTVEIQGLDLQADGGTHVANTREVGTIRIADYKSKGRLNKRIAIALE